ncbi:MAG: glycosyltransferase, partial [Candidatus Omnitrophica bacterium]|nr:glycosyltransferase [Candidatus Omnitrophota bacterium]
MDYPMVSVVVPVFNAETTIAHVVQSLLSQTYPGLTEVILVDDGSTDQTSEILKSFPEIIYLKQNNAGPAAARNRGATESRGDFILFTDSDCIAHKDWMAQIVDGFKDPRVGAVCGSYGIANPQKILAACIHSEIIYRHRIVMPVYPRAFGSYNVGIRREVFFCVGGFNEYYRQASGEDNDLSYKIINKGWLIYLNKSALVDHFHTTKVVKYLKEQFRHGFWRAKMYGDHPAMARGDDYTFWKDIFEVPVVCLVLVFTALLGYERYTSSILLIIVCGFLLLEFIFANLFCVKFFSKIFFTFVMFFRAFARVFG